MWRQWVKSERLRLGIGLREFAEMAIPDNHVRYVRIEQGNVLPTGQEVLVIMDAIEVASLTRVRQPSPLEQRVAKLELQVTEARQVAIDLYKIGRASGIKYRSGMYSRVGQWKKRMEGT